MRKIITYSSFAVATGLVSLVFLTATTYAQLAAASILYLPLAFFAYHILRVFITPAVTTTGHVVNAPTQFAHVPVQPSPHPLEDLNAEQPTENPTKAEVVDIDRRSFLKLIGGIGLTLFLSTLFGRKAENLIFQKNEGDASSSPGASPAEGYQISEADDSEQAFYGFTNKKGNWFIMKEDPDTGSFRYAKGESDFPGNWASREKLNYDYYHNLF